MDGVGSRFDRDGSTDVTGIDVHARAAVDIALVATAIHIAANLDLGGCGEGTGQRNDK